MWTSIRTLLAAAGAGIVLASCATGPYDYAYDDSGYPGNGYYGYGYEPGYYVGPSVDFGAAYYGRDHDRDWRDHDRDWRHGGGDRDRGDGYGGSTSQYNPSPLQCCGPGSGPDGAVTQRDADRWGSGG